MTAVLELADVTFRRDGKQIIDGISLTVQEGEHWALLGPNGAGKSTLLGFCAAVTFPTSGSVRILGEQMGRVDLSRLRHSIGHVNPRHRLQYPLTVREVVLTGITACDTAATLVGCRSALPVAIAPMSYQRAVHPEGEIGMARAAKEAGCQVPGRLLIAGGVDSVHAREGDPPVTALDLHPDRQAEMAVEMLLARLGDGEVEAPRHIPATLRVRASTGGGSDPDGG